MIISTWLSDYHTRELKTLIKYRFAIYWQDQPHWSYLAAQLLLDFAPRIASPLQVPYKMKFKFNTASSHYKWKNYNFFPTLPVWQRGGGGFKSLVGNTQIGEVTIIEAPPLDVKLALQLFFQFRKKNVAPQSGERISIALI